MPRARRNPERPDDELAPCFQTAAAVLDALKVRADEGLSADEVAVRRTRHGANETRRHRPRSVWRILLDQFRGMIVLLLVAALVLSAVTGDWLEAAAIGVVILINAIIGFVSELRAVRSMEALRRLGQATATVRRASAAHRVAARELVPGDIVLVDAGDVVTADLRIVEASKARADESTLTGESMPVDKNPEPVAADTPLAERRCMLYKGTALTRGAVTGVVCAIGMATELGRITALVDEDPDEDRTPLEKRLGKLGRSLVYLTLAIAVIVALAGLLTGRDPELIVKTSIALAVAAIPEGLPIVATLALARGMWRMAKRNVAIKRLAAVETLGATTVIFSDKTGTLTENQMTVRRLAVNGGDVEIGGAAFDEAGPLTRDGSPVIPGDDPAVAALLELGVLCSSADWQAGEDGARHPVGDPMEVALLVAAVKAGFEPAAVRDAMPEVDRIAFDTSVNMMATTHRAPDGFRVAVKGAPEAVIQTCDSQRSADGESAMDANARAAWLDRNEALAEAGMRVLAFAEKFVSTAGQDPYEKLTLVGLAGLVDPPRVEVRPTINACRSAGVRVVMVTGDQASTARHVATALGIDIDSGVVQGADLARAAGDDADPDSLLRASIFARVSPEQKLDLLRLARRRGEVAAMLGDGVNDAPALQAADIGVAMGVRGTDVAREASDMILRDDALTSVAEAVRQGRIIFDNIRTFIRYLISCNLSEILVVLLAVAVQAPLPILPLQILFLNLITDVFPALALGMGEGDARVMERPPRNPDEPILTRRHWIAGAIDGSIMAVSVLAALLIARGPAGLDEVQAVTVSFLTLAFAQLWHVFDMRAPRSNPVSNEVTQNQFVWLALLLCTALILAAVYVPVIADALDTRDPGPQGWLLVACFSVAPALVGQLRLQIARRPATV